MLALVFKSPENAACLMQSEMSSSLCAELCTTGDFQIQVIMHITHAMAYICTF